MVSWTLEVPKFVGINVRKCNKNLEYKFECLFCSPGKVGQSFHSLRRRVTQSHEVDDPYMLVQLQCLVYGSLNLDNVV